MTYAVIVDRTPSRATVVRLYDDLDAAERAAEALDTGINGMPAEVIEVSEDAEPGERIWL